MYRGAVDQRRAHTAIDYVKSGDLGPPRDGSLGYYARKKGCPGFCSRKDRKSKIENLEILKYSEYIVVI